MEAVGQLSGGIAHDFNNLLTVIIGNGDLLAEKLKEQRHLHHLSAMIVAAGERGAELTRRLLAFSRRQTLQPLAIDCNQHIAAIQQILRRVLREDIEIRTTLDPLLKAAFSDPAQLESVILNLALNAQDAMEGGGCLTIATTNATLDSRYRENHEDVKPGEYVMVSVTDNGEGMTSAVRDQAFEPFFTTKAIGKGSGRNNPTDTFRCRVSLGLEPPFGSTCRLLSRRPAKLMSRQCLARCRTVANVSWLRRTIRLFAPSPWRASKISAIA
jgi:signal transduction histidine kinase